MSAKGSRRTKVNVHLYIGGFECPPDEVTDILGITPTGTKVRGQPMSRTNTRPVKQNGWTLQAPGFGTNAAPEEQAEALMKIVAPHAKNFRKLPPGSEISLTCAIYAYDDEHRIFWLSSEVVGTLAAIGAPAHFAYYAIGEHP